MSPAPAVLVDRSWPGLVIDQQAQRRPPSAIAHQTNPLRRAGPKAGPRASGPGEPKARWVGHASTGGAGVAGPARAPPSAAPCSAGRSSPGLVVNRELQAEASELLELAARQVPIPRERAVRFVRELVMAWPMGAAVLAGLDCARFAGARLVDLAVGVLAQASVRSERESQSGTGG